MRACLAHRGRTGLAGAGILALLALGSVDALLAGPMRTWSERAMNSKLKGYSVRIARVRPHLWRLAIELEDVVLVQTTHPHPPVADFGALRFSLLFRELLRFKVAGNLTLERPALHLNLAQIAEQTRNRASLKEQGWQRAVESVYPFKLDRVEVRDGSLLYLSDRTAAKPLQLTKVHMLAQNVRNIAAAKRTYPSPVSLEGLLFETGQVSFQGAADFLREPYVAARGEIRLQRIPLERLTPIAQDFQLKTTGGFLTLHGTVERTPEVQMAHFAEVLFEDLRVDYVTSPATASEERAHGQQALQLAKRVRDAPKLRLKVDSLKLRQSQIGFENQRTQPPYRLYISDVNLDLSNLSNQAGEERSRFEAQGAFMGSGAAVLSGGARTTASPADFDVQLKLEEARLSDLNGFLMAHAGVDVAAGLFSLYVEFAVKDHRVAGYVKPHIKGLKVYDKAKDQWKPFGKRVEMRLLQSLASLFKNRSSQEVATVTRISGSTSHPEASTWEALRKLFSNGFSRPIRPGFLPEAKR